MLFYLSPLKYAYWGKQSGCKRTCRWSCENFIWSAGAQSFFSPFSLLPFIFLETLPGYQEVWSLNIQTLFQGTTSIPTFVTQNGQWPLRGGGGLSNGRFPWTKWDFCSGVKKLYKNCINKM